MRVAIDPGHGHKRSPTGVTRDTFVERDYVLDLARDVIAFAPWARWTLLRSRPNGDPYSERAVRAKTEQAQLVICLHVNAAEDPATSGMITFYDLADPVGAEAALAIARAAPFGLRRARRESFPVAPTNWTKRVHSVLTCYRQLDLPAVLVEVGHVTSDDDRAIMLSPASRPALCCSIIAGVCRAAQMS